MAEIISPEPLPTDVPHLSDDGAAWLADAREKYEEGGQQILEPEAFEALCDVVPRINTIGWAVIRDAWTEEWVESFEPVEKLLGSQTLSADERFVLEGTRKQALPVLSALVRLSRVGERTPSNCFGSHASINLSVDGFNRHADCGDGHTFLANPLIQRETTMVYELGDDVGAQQEEHLGTQEIEVSGRSLLVIAGQAVKNETEVDNDGNLLPPFRSVAHGVAGQPDGWSSRSAVYGRVRLVAYAHHTVNGRQLPMPRRRYAQSLA